MENNLFSFSGIFISKEQSLLIEVKGEFDTHFKESVYNYESVFIFKNIIFKNKSLLTCKVSSEDERFKNVESLEFIFDKENNCFVAEVLQKKTYFPLFKRSLLIDTCIEKDSQSRDEIGMIILHITSKNMQNYEAVKKRFNYLSENKIRREETNSFY